MGDRVQNHQIGLDFQRGRGIVVSISISTREPPFHLPGVALRRRDLTALRARAFSRISAATFSPPMERWVKDLDQLHWENILMGMRLVPWVVYAALWLVSEPLAARAGPEDVDGGLGGLSDSQQGGGQVREPDRMGASGLDHHGFVHSTP